MKQEVLLLDCREPHLIAAAQLEDRLRHLMASLEGGHDVFRMASPTILAIQARDCERQMKTWLNARQIDRLKAYDDGFTGLCEFLKELKVRSFEEATAVGAYMHGSILDDLLDELKTGFPEALSTPVNRSEDEPDILDRAHFFVLKSVANVWGKLKKTFPLMLLDYVSELYPEEGELKVLNWSLEEGYLHISLAKKGDEKGERGVWRDLLQSTSSPAQKMKRGWLTALANEVLADEALKVRVSRRSIVGGNDFSKPGMAPEPVTALHRLDETQQLIEKLGIGTIKPTL